MAARAARWLGKHVLQSLFATLLMYTSKEQRKPEGTESDLDDEFSKNICITTGTGIDYIYFDKVKGSETSNQITFENAKLLFPDIRG